MQVATMAFLINIIKSIMPILFSSVLGFFFARLSLLTSVRKEILKEELELIYLPLYLEIRKKSISINLRYTLLIKTFKLYEKYPLLISYDFKKVYDRLNSDYIKDNDNLESTNNFVGFITYEYESIRRKLGYPSTNYFKSLRFADSHTKKIAWIKFSAFIVYSLTLIVLSFINTLAFDIVGIIASVILLILSIRK